MQIKTLVPGFALTGFFAATQIAAYSTSSNAAKYDGDVSHINPESFKVAAVRQPPVNYAYPLVQNTTWVDLDLNATVDQAIDIIAQAQAEGVNLIAFPELYFPG